MDIPSNLRIITSGKVPTVQTCPLGCVAFGIVDGKPRIFFNSDNSIKEITATDETPEDIQDQINSHQSAEMPHQFKVGVVNYKYGFRVDEDGSLIFKYEEV